MCKNFVVIRELSGIYWDRSAACYSNKKLNIIFTLKDILKKQERLKINYEIKVQKMACLR